MTTENDMISPVEEEETDIRMDFLFEYVQKTMRIKSEKWFKLIGNEETLATVKQFLDTPDVMVLSIIQNVSGQLLPSHHFPSNNLKYKAPYFIKRSKGPIPKENIRSSVIFGDVSPNPINELAVLVDEVFVPLLSDSNNQIGWPSVVSEDVCKHLQSLSSLIYQVDGEMRGETLLPLPVGIDCVHEAERILIDSNGECLDLHLKSAIEGTVIKWAAQINDILQEDSSSDNAEHPLPISEIIFWNNRLKNLECIYYQLQNSRVKKMASILEVSKSAYFPCFKKIFQNVVAALIEARDITIYLNTLRNSLSALEEAEVPEIPSLLLPLMHTVCLVWANSSYYCSSSHIIVLLQQICNQLIEETKKFLDPSNIFLSEVDETLMNVNMSLSMIDDFRDVFDYCRDNMDNYFEGKEPLKWNFHPELVFERLNRFKGRLILLKVKIFSVIARVGLIW